MTALQWIVKEAKAIKKKYPKRFAKWTDYVAQASAIYSSKHKGKSPVGKKHVKKVVRKKALGALPIGFKGNIWGIHFKVVNQYDIYGNVAAIVENTETGHRIVTFDGRGSANELANVFSGYVARHGTGGSTNEADLKALKSRILKFCTQMQKEVKDFNSGKKKTIKKEPLSIPTPKHKIPSVKKVAKKVAKKHTHWGNVHSHQRRVNGVKKKKISEQSILNKIHKVKDDVSKLDEAQHKHMIGKISLHNIDKIKSSLQELKNLERHLAILKIVKPKIVKTQLPVIKNEIKNTINSIKEIKIHIKELKKHI